jgi:hypothetical protein
VDYYLRTITYGLLFLEYEAAVAFAEDWIDSWNSHDIERILSHYAQEIEFYSPLIVERYADLTGVITSRVKLKEYFSLGLAKNTALKFKLLEVLVGVNQILLYYENARGGRTGEFFEFGSGSKVIRSSSCYSN